MKKCTSSLSFELSFDSIEKKYQRRRKSYSTKDLDLLIHQLEYNRDEFIKEACNFLGSIELKEKKENVFIKSSVDKEKNSKNYEMKIFDHCIYKKQDLINDANAYLSNLPKIIDNYRKMKHNRLKNNISSDPFYYETEREFGLRIMKLDKKKISYIYHLENPMIYNKQAMMDLDDDQSCKSIEEVVLRKLSSNLNPDNKSEILTTNSLKKVKYEIFSICPLLDVDYGLACYAWVYFEFLINKGIVNIKNKSLILSICFLLALKFYDIDDENTIKCFYEIIPNIFKDKVKREEILKNEIKIYAALNFSLMAPIELVNKQIENTLKFVLDKGKYTSEIIN